MASTIFPSPPPPFEDFTWYGNIQYLINISAIGALSCLLIFLLLKLRSDHRRIPGPFSLYSKLLAVWHATAREIALHCGADASQFLVIEGGTFTTLSGTCIVALFAVFVNFYLGNALMDDVFEKTTITHIKKGGFPLWVHFVFMVGIVYLVQKGVFKIEEWLKFTRFRDGYGNPSDPSAITSAVFSIMIQGVPKSLAFDKSAFEEYFQFKYPGKVFRVIVPMDLSNLDDLVEDLVKVRENISKLVAKMDARFMYGEGEDGDELLREYRGSRVGDDGVLGKVKWFWGQVCERLNSSDEMRLKRLQELRADLETKVAAYKEGRGQGAGVAFVVFKDVYTANKAVQDFRMEKRMRIGRFFSLTELQLERNQWKVERAPLASDIYWNHLGSTKLSLKLRRILVNTLLLLMLLFFSSPLAVISALQRAGRIINAEAMDNAKSWLSWLQSSSWFAVIFFQFLPNVLVFVSMYIIIPAILSYLSKFEKHLTVSEEQKAALIKMVCFFLVNLIVLRGLVESSLESTILSMGRCYLDGEDCKRIEQYMSASFLAKSCLSTLAFLITCTFLGISVDLLAPIPWIKRNLQKFRKNDMLQLVPEQVEDYPLVSEGIDSLRRPLISEEVFDPAIRNGGSLNVIDLQGQDLSVYPVSNGAPPARKQKFDFALYYAFNLTIFALTMIYSSFAPLVVLVGAIYFGYRYMVDKYNFLFVYRVRGFPAGNDGKLMDTVLSTMLFCVDLYLISMLIFFSIHGDSMKLQAIFTLGVLVIYKLLPSGSDSFQPTILQGVPSVDCVLEGPIDYEVLSQPRFEWDTIYS